jgi:hypothetical protein
LDASKI